VVKNQSGLVSNPYNKQGVGSICGYFSCFELLNCNSPLIGAYQKEELDDDPFYEHYNCHKLTYIELLNSDPLNNFEKCEFAKEDTDDIIQMQMKMKTQV
jgi:hypothetical protein